MLKGHKAVLDMDDGFWSAVAEALMKSLIAKYQVFEAVNPARLCMLGALCVGQLTSSYRIVRHRDKGLVKTESFIHSPVLCTASYNGIERNQKVT